MTLPKRAAVWAGIWPPSPLTSSSGGASLGRLGAKVLFLAGGGGAGSSRAGTGRAGAAVEGVKAESKYRAFALNLKYIQDSQLSDRDKNAFINGHVLSHVEYELCKLFENDADRERLFGLLVDACHRHQIKKYLIRRFGALRTRCIVDDDYQAFTSYKTRRIYLFALVPFIRIESVPARKHINLFEIIPLLKIK